jgi:prepilin-type N-terminal cleavage/methylation domain-containing protein
MNVNQSRKPATCAAAFSLIEVMVAVAIVGVLFVSLYTGITSGFGVISLARENLRATQILQEKMETIRLYNWDQINTAGFIPSSFTAPFFPEGQTNVGVIYNGTMLITNAPIAETYSNDLRLVVLEVRWISGQIERHREMRTFVARHGLQNYIY